MMRRAVARGRDVQEDEFVGALRIVGPGAFDGVTRISKLLEPDALDDAPGGHVKARNDTAAKHGSALRVSDVRIEIDDQPVGLSRAHDQRMIAHEVLRMVGIMP